MFQLPPEPLELQPSGLGSCCCDFTPESEYNQDQSSVPGCSPARTAGNLGIEGAGLKEEKKEKSKKLKTRMKRTKEKKEGV